MDPVVRQLAAWALPGAGPIASPPDLPGALDLVDVARAERLLGPLLLAVDVGDVIVAPEVRDYLVNEHLRAQRWCAQVEHRLLEVEACFDAVGGIRHVASKGPAVAHLDEPDPALRSFADVDLLVAGADVDRAVAALLDAGAHRPWPERRPGYDRRFAKSVTLTCADGVEVDLHRSIVDGAHGFRVPMERILDEAVSFELGGRQIPAPMLIHRFLHGAWHAVLGSPQPRAVNLRDLAQHLVDERLAPEFVVPEAERWRGVAVLVVAVSETLDSLGVSAPAWSAWAAATGPKVSRREATIVARQRAEGSGLGRGKVDALGELPWRARPAYLAGLLAPSRPHLEGRGLRRRHLLGRVHGADGTSP